MRIIFFAVFTIVFVSILFGMHFFVWRVLKRIGIIESVNWQWAMLALSFSYMIVVMSVRYIPNIITNSLYFLASVWLGIIFLLFSIFLFYQVIYFFSKTDSYILAWIFLMIVAALTAYGIINAANFKIRNIDLQIANLPRPLTVVQLSDMHVGTIHQEKYLKRIVSAVNSQNPDLVLVTGDLFDGTGPIEARVIKPLDDIKADIFFSNGNHEAYEGLDRVSQALSESRLKLLDNKNVEWGGIQIIGVDDPAGRTRGEKLGTVLGKLDIKKDIPAILLYHSPSGWREAREFGVDLQLSGHTHNGQILPFNLLVKMFYPKIRGLYDLDGMYLYTSPGTGTWGPPMRIGSSNEITVFNLTPKIK